MSVQVQMQYSICSAAPAVNPDRPGSTSAPAIPTNQLAAYMRWPCKSPFSVTLKIMCQNVQRHPRSSSPRQQVYTERVVSLRASLQSSGLRVCSTMPGRDLVLEELQHWGATTACYQRPRNIADQQHKVNISIPEPKCESCGPGFGLPT